MPRKLVRFDVNGGSKTLFTAPSGQGIGSAEVIDSLD